MKLGKGKQFILFGGGDVLAALAAELHRKKRLRAVISAERHLQTPIVASGSTLESFLRKLDIPFVDTDQVNSDPKVHASLDAQAIGIAFGAAWTFEKSFVAKLDGAMVDFMGIRLPQYRGGAHFTWQILRSDRLGASHMQLILGGEDTFHKGPILKSKEYRFPTDALTPADYYKTADAEGISFSSEFVAEIDADKEFPLVKLDEQSSTYFPFLNTLRHGFINWDWTAEELYRFLSAFDDPYAGASTFLNGKRVFLKKATLETSLGTFHPFYSGLVFRVTSDALFVATRTHVLVIKEVLDQEGRSLLKQIAVGDRFVTPRDILEEALGHRTVYDAAGELAPS